MQEQDTPKTVGTTTDGMTTEINIETARDTARKSYINMTRIVDSVCRWVPDDNINGYLAKFAALDGLCEVISSMHNSYCEFFGVSTLDEELDPSSTLEERICAMIYGLYLEVYEARRGLKDQRIWTDILRSAGAYIGRIPDEEIDELSLSWRHHKDNSHEIPF